MPLLFDLNREKASNVPVGMLNEFRLINGPKRFVVVLSFFPFVDTVTTGGLNSNNAEKLICILVFFYFIFLRRYPW